MICENENDNKNENDSNENENDSSKKDDNNNEDDSCKKDDSKKDDSNKNEFLPIISWDVGLYNLSYCILQKTLIYDNEMEKDETYIPKYTVKILKWAVFPISNKESNEIKSNKIGVYEKIPLVLDAISDILNVSDVLIENQPSMKNPTTKSIQIILFTYFVLHKQKSQKLFGIESPIKNIEFISASNKLKIYDGPLLECKLKSEYSQRKYFAKEHTKYFLEKYNDNEFLDFFIKSKKQDDLADSYLQGLYYIKDEYDKYYKSKIKKMQKEKLKLEKLEKEKLRKEIMKTKKLEKQLRKKQVEN